MYYIYIYIHTHIHTYVYCEQNMKPPAALENMKSFASLPAMRLPASVQKLYICVRCGAGWGGGGCSRAPPGLLVGPHGWLPSWGNPRHVGNVTPRWAHACAHSQPSTLTELAMSPPPACHI